MSNISTGYIELNAKKLTILNSSKTPPFEINNENVDETTRLNVTYNNLSSLGFYQHQHNKYSLLDFNIQYFDNNKRYNCSRKKQ